MAIPEIRTFLAAPYFRELASDRGLGRKRVRQFVDPLDMRDRGTRTGGLGHQVERLVLIVVDRRQRLIHVTITFTIARGLDRLLGQPGKRREDHKGLARRLPGQPRPEQEKRLWPQTGSTLGRVTAPKDSDLDRMNAFQAGG